MTLKNAKILLLLTCFCYCKKPEPVTGDVPLTENLSQKTQSVLFVAAKSGIHLREEPSEKSKSLQILKQHTPVYIMEITNTPVTIQGASGRWVSAYADQKEGYVFSGFLAKSSGEKIFSPSKSAYYSLEIKSDFRCSKENFDDCLIYSAYESNGTKIREIESFKPQGWLNDDEIEFETHAADGGGFHYANFKKNIRTGIESNIYSYSGDFDDDHNGFRDLYYCVLKSCIFFRFDVKKNEFSVRDILEPAKSNIKAGKSFFESKISVGKVPSLGETDKYFTLLAKKSLEYTNRIIFSLRGEEYEIRFPEKKVIKH